MTYQQINVDANHFLQLMATLFLAGVAIIACGSMWRARVNAKADKAYEEKNKKKQDPLAAFKFHQALANEYKALADKMGLRPFKDEGEQKPLEDRNYL